MTATMTYLHSIAERVKYLQEQVEELPDSAIIESLQVIYALIVDAAEHVA